MGNINNTYRVLFNVYAVCVCVCVCRVCMYAVHTLQLLIPNTKDRQSRVSLRLTGALTAFYCFFFFVAAAVVVFVGGLL